MTSELIDARGVREQLTGAQHRLADLQQARTTRTTRRWGRPGGPAADGIGRDAGDVVEALRRTGTGTVEATAAGYTDAGRVASAVTRSIAAAWAAIRAVPGRWWLRLAALVAAVTVAGWAVGVGVEQHWWADGWRWLVTAPAVAGLLTVAGAVREGWARSAGARENTRRAWAAAQAWTEQRQRRLDTAIAVAQAEVDRLNVQVRDLTAAGQLAGLVSERAAQGRYRERLGLMTQIRQDFQTMADLLLAANTPEPRPAGGCAPSPVPEKDEAGDTLPRIERIVVYIDDLDRCPPTRVVEVLEAVHLLLASRLFVVVVAVDPRWLLSAITSHYQNLFHPADPATTAATVAAGGLDPSWADGPAQYLEKIFQVVFTLPPLADGGYQRMIDNLVGVRADTPDSPDDPDSPGAAAKPQTSAVRGQGASPDPAPAGWDPTALYARRLRRVERVDPLALTPDELTLLQLLGPPLVTSPRAVKRLANSYGLLAAIGQASPAGRTDLQPDPHDPTVYPYRAAMVLLGAVVGYPDLGPVLFPALHHAADDKTQTWLGWLNEMRPQPRQAHCQTEPSGKRLHPAEGVITPARADRWDHLITALTRLDTRATQAALPLPQLLAHWRRWVVPVGRLSFPTGPAVVHLTPGTRPQD